MCELSTVCPMCGRTATPQDEIACNHHTDQLGQHVVIEWLCPAPCGAHIRIGA